MREISKEFIFDGGGGSITLKQAEKLMLDMELTLDNPINKTDVIKVNLLSDDKMFNGGLAEMHGNVFRISKSIEPGDCFNTDSIYGAQIIRKNVFTEEICVLTQVNFDDGVKDKLEFLQTNPAYREYLKEAENLNSPLKNGEIALENLYKSLGRGNADNAYKLHFEAICRGAEAFPILNQDMPHEFIWHTIDTLEPISSTSCFSHILSAPDVIAGYERYGHYLLGIKKDSNTICFAIPTDEDAPCPIPHVEDCCVYIRHTEYDYCTVCVILAPEGQYFTHIH